MQTPAAIVIAAGGIGARMGGDKPNRLLCGATLLEHVHGWAQPQSPHIAVAGDHAPVPPDCPRLPDALQGLGPIGALDSAMGFAAAGGCATVLLLGCDLPFLPPDLLPRLSQALGDGLVAAPASGEHLHVMAALWRVDPASLDAYIASGGRSMHGFALRQGVVRLDWETDDPFFNVNTLDDLRAAEVRMRGQG